MPDIYTIGHSNSSMVDFAGLLVRYGISLLVDVRTIPYSRWYPQFNRGSVANSLSAFNIAYQFWGESLGGMPSDPSLYRNGIIPVDRKKRKEAVDYVAFSRSRPYLNALSRLMELTVERKTAIMCSEENPVPCHRHHLIARSLVDMGVSVWHIRGGGLLENAAFYGEKPEERIQGMLFE